MAKTLKTSPQGRKCIYAGCTSNLSIYNHQDYCHLHLDRMLQPKKPKPVEIGTLILGAIQPAPVLEAQIEI